MPVGKVQLLIQSFALPHSIPIQTQLFVNLQGPAPRSSVLLTVIVTQCAVNLMVVQERKPEYVMALVSSGRESPLANVLPALLIAINAAPRLIRTAITVPLMIVLLIAPVLIIHVREANACSVSLIAQHAALQPLPAAPPAYAADCTAGSHICQNGACVTCTGNCMNGSYAIYQIYRTCRLLPNDCAVNCTGNKTCQGGTTGTCVACTRNCSACSTTTFTDANNCYANDCAANCTSAHTCQGNTCVACSC